MLIMNKILNNKKMEQEKLLLTERELEIMISVKGVEYLFEIDISNIIEATQMMPIDIINNIEGLKIAVKDFKQDDK